MRVGGSLANGADGGVAVPLERSRVGEGLVILNRRIVERLRATDGELRAKIRKEALQNSGAPHFIDTRGPDLGLYTVDGMVLGGLMASGGQVAPRLPVPPSSEAQQSRNQIQTVTPGNGQRTQGARPVVGAAVSTGARVAETYSPAKGAPVNTAALVGLKRDLTA